MIIKNNNKITNPSFKFKKKKLFFRKYNYMNKIFPKIYFKFLQFDLKCIHFIVFMVLSITSQHLVFPIIHILILM